MTKIDEKYIKIIKIILILIWMIVVFKFSNQGGNESSNTSSKVTKAVVNIVTKNEESKEQKVEQYEVYVRKEAHYTIYTIGGFLIMSYTYSTKKSKKQKIIYSLLFGMAYAATDETHQYFVPGRSARLYDVGIDTLGVFTGICIYLGCIFLINKLKNVEKA